MKLPNLLKVEIDQAEVLNFRGNQDCGTNDLRVPLIPFNETGNFVRVSCYAQIARKIASGNAMPG